MKAFILALALFSGPALCDPVLLYSTGCTRIRLCGAISNGGGYAISLYANTANQSVTLTVDGKSYYSPTGNTPATYVGPNIYGGEIAGLVLTATDGAAVTLSASFSGYHHLINSGRAHWWVTDWTLISGQIDGLMNAPNPFADPPPVPMPSGPCEQCHSR